jgi:lysophospholipase L1-like esterase
VLPGEAQHVDIAKYAENLHTTISMITSPTSPYYSPHTRIILITPPPVNPNQRPEEPWATRNNVNTKAYAQQVLRVGEETGVEVLDAWELLWEKVDGMEERLTPYLSDGLHLTAAAYEVGLPSLNAKTIMIVPPVLVNRLFSMRLWRRLKQSTQNSIQTNMTAYSRR